MADLAVANLALADRDPLALIVVDFVAVANLCWQSLIQVFVKLIQRLLYSLQCDQLTCCCCIQIQGTVALE